MTIRVAAALAGVALLIDTAAGQDPAADPENAVVPAAEDLAAGGLVPVALTGTSEAIAVGVLVRSKHPSARGKLGVCLPAASARSVRSVYAWIDDGSGNPAWQNCTITSRQTKSLLICSMPDNPKLAAMDPGSLQALPKSLDHLVIAEWSVLAAAAAAAPGANPGEAATLEDQLRNEFRLLNEEYEHLNRPPRAGDEKLTPQERRRKILEVTRRLREVRNEAAQNRIRFTSPGRRTGPPERGAILRRIAVQGDLEEKEPGKMVLTLQEPLPARNGAAPRLLLTATSGRTTDVYPLQEIADLIDPPVQSPTAYLDLPESSDPTLVFQPPPLPPFLQVAKVEVFAAPAGQFPEDLSKAPFKASSTYNREVKLRIPRSAIVSGKPIEVKWARNSRDAEEAELFEPFEITFTKIGQSLEPRVTDSQAVTWQAPAPAPNTKTPDLPAPRLLKQLATEGAIVRAASAGDRYLVVHDAHEHTLRVLDVAAEQWVAALPFPEAAGLRFAVNADSLFVSDPRNGTLSSHALPGLAKTASLKLPRHSIPRALGIGSLSRDAPLLLVFEDRIELRDPRTLRPHPAIVHLVNRSSSSGPVNHLAGAPLRQSGIHRARVLASAAGDLFYLATEIDLSPTRTNKSSMALDLRGERWEFGTTTSPFVPASGGVRLHYNQATSREKENVSLASASSSHPVFPVGSGYCRLTDLPYTPTYPGSPATLQFYRNVGDAQPLLTVRAGSAAAAGAQKGSDLIARLHVFPTLGKAASVGRKHIDLEALFDPGAGAGAPRLAAFPPAAVRGTRWTYHPFGEAAGPAALHLLDGPTGTQVGEDGSFTWDVPLDYPLDYAYLKFTIGADRPQDAQIPFFSVQGTPALTVRKVKPEERTAVPTRKLFFPEEIDRVLPSHSRALLVIASGGYRKFTCVDRKTLQPVAEFLSPAGVAAPALAPDALYLYYFENGTIEKRSLPGLTPVSLRPSDTPDQLIAFTVGSAEGALPPIAFFRASSGYPSRYVARELDPGSLRLSPPFSFTESHTVATPVRGHFSVPLATSADGAKILYGEEVLERAAGQAIIPRKLRGARRAQPAGFFRDGNTLLLGQSALDIQTWRAWSLSKPGAQPILLFGDLDDRFVVAAHLPRKPEEGESRIVLLDPATQEPRFELSPLVEWRNHPLHGAFAHSLLHGDDLHLWSRSGLLVTVSPARHHLLFRQLPPLVTGSE